MRGDGWLLNRRGVWYACTWQNGRPVRESLKTRDRDEAQVKLLQLRRKRELGQYVAPKARRLTVGQLLDDLLLDMEVRAIAALPKIRSTMKALRAEFGRRPAVALDTASVQRAQKAWLAAGKAPATINRRCELLRQAYRRAARHQPPKVAQVPYIPLLPARNARQGFVAPGDFERLVRAVQNPDIRDFVEWCGWTGMRPGEVRQLTWEMVDLEAGVVRLSDYAAKTRRSRAVALTAELEAIVKRRLKARRLGCPLVFHRQARGRPGQPVRDYRKAWREALVRARLPLTLLPYDLRRSALRNMVRAGVDVTVAMKISGHRTRSTFDRYNIVSEDDVRAALERTASYVKARRTADKHR